MNSNISKCKHVLPTPKLGAYPILPKYGPTIINCGHSMKEFLPAGLGNHRLLIDMFWYFSLRVLSGLQKKWVDFCSFQIRLVNGDPTSLSDYSQVGGILVKLDDGTQWVINKQV